MKGITVFKGRVCYIQTIGREDGLTQPSTSRLLIWPSVSSMGGKRAEMPSRVTTVFVQSVVCST